MPASNTEATGDGLPIPRRWWAIVAISFGTALTVIDSAVANVALPTIARDLGVDSGAVTNVVTVYQLVLVMGLLPFASLGERMGSRRLYQRGQMLFIVASGLCLFADNLPLLLGLRAFQAVGAGMVLSVSSAMIRQIYPAARLGTGLGVNSVIVASSYALGPTAGGFIVTHLPWVWVFVAAVPLGLVSLLLGRTLPDPIRRDTRPEWLSGGWTALTMLLLIGGVQVGTHGSLAAGIAAGVAGLVSAVLLVRREAGRAEPVVPVDLLRRPVIGLSALASLFAFTATAGILLTLPFRLEEVFDYPPQTVGLLVLPWPLTLLVVSPLAGWLSDRVAATKLGVTGMALAIVGLLLLAFMPMDAGAVGIGWRLALSALGFGLFIAPNSRLMIARSPRERAAAAGGMLSTARLLGQTTGAVTGGILLAGGIGTGAAPMLLGCGLAAVAALCSVARFRSVRGATP